MRIKNLTIKGFRGFNKEQRILLDSNIVLIYGLNASGKSSFTEALEWLFFGEISRQRLSSCKSEYRYEEYLRNLFYSSPDNPFVAAEGTIAGESIIIKKEIASTGEKCFINGSEVENFDSLNLDLDNYFRPMLAQTEIKALVDSEQKDRWEQLSSILGQDDLTSLRENLISLRNKKRDENYKNQEIKWKSILSDISELGALASLTHSVTQLNLNSTIAELQKLLESKEKSLDRLLKKTKDKQKGLLNTELGNRITDVSYRDQEKLKEYLNEFVIQVKNLEDKAEKSTKSGFDHTYLDFLKSGISLSKLPKCPFCLARSLTKERLHDIEKSLDQGVDAQKAKSQFIQIKRSIDQWINLFSNKINDYLLPQQELKIIAQKFLDINEEEFASSTQSLERKINDLNIKLHKEIKNICKNTLSCIENKYFHKPIKEPYANDINDSIAMICSSTKSTNQEWDILKSKITEKLTLSGQANQEELKKWLLVEKIIKFFNESKTFIKQNYILKMINEIQEKLEKYEKAEVDRLLGTHAGEIKSYYKRLNPGDQIQFSGIEVKGGNKRQAKLKAEAFGKAVNPVTFFSEAHTNSLALSIYFPQRVDRNSTWETVILDDPVQSMDENHSRALIDILADISKMKQVIILTHSKAFYRRLCAIFHHLKPKFYSFYYNEESGPSIILREGETLDYLKFIEGYCQKGDPNSIETASSQLRKAIESVCLEILLENGVGFSKARKIQKKGLDSLFIEVEKNGLPPSDTGKLKSLLDTSNNDSHAWSITDSTPGGIRTGIKYINAIYEKYL